MQLENGSKGFVRGLGHIELCGVLHICWQTKDGVEGRYLICLLYKDFLLLASASRVEQVYTIHGCIGLAELRIEEIDNGRGTFQMLHISAYDSLYIVKYC